LSIKVKIEKTSNRKFEEIKEFANLEDAINYCYDLKDKERLEFGKIK